MEDAILVSGLEVMAPVGITAEERATPQRLRISLRLVPGDGLRGLKDDLARTVDYAAVCEAVRDEVARRERNLIETLAEDVAEVLLGRFSSLKRVEIEVRKYVLPETEWVGVAIARER